MSYSIYKTEAVIMRIVPNGEANLDVTFFTRDLGKITARVQSARKQESKMRMHLTRYNHVMIDVVRGKAVWRLTGIHGLGNLSVFRDEKFLKVWYRITSLAEHLVRGEEPHPDLFELFITLAAWQLTTDGLEIFGVIQVLHLLGYWHGPLVSRVPTQEIVEQCIAQKKELIKMINESIEATQIVV